MGLLAQKHCKLLTAATSGKPPCVGIGRLGFASALCYLIGYFMYTVYEQEAQ